MADKVLFVDDDPNVLSAFQRNLRRDFEIVTVPSPEEAIQTLEADPSFGVIVSDLKMPRMNGIELLTLTSGRWPDTVRILLTGEANTNAAIAAVNQGHVYRFLIKPVALTPLSRILSAALQQHNLVIAERELLERTLAGSMKVLTEILGMLHPLAFSRASRIQNTVRQLVTELQLPNPWEFQVAAMLSLIGCIALPDELLRKVCDGHPLTENEQRLFQTHPATGARLLQSIPRLETICQMIERQEQPLELLGPGQSVGESDRALLGAYLLKLANHFDSLTASGLSKIDVLDRLQRGEQAYRPELLQLLAGLESIALDQESRYIKFRELSIGMVPQTDIVSLDDMLLLAKGHIISQTVLECLERYAASCGIREPIQVLLPPPGPTSAADRYIREQEVVPKNGTARVYLPGPVRPES